MYSSSSSYSLIYNRLREHAKQDIAENSEGLWEYMCTCLTRLGPSTIQFGYTFYVCRTQHFTTDRLCGHFATTTVRFSKDARTCKEWFKLTDGNPRVSNNSQGVYSCPAEITDSFRYLKLLLDGSTLLWKSSFLGPIPSYNFLIYPVKSRIVFIIPIRKQKRTKIQ